MNDFFNNLINSTGLPNSVVTQVGMGVFILVSLTMFIVFLTRGVRIIVRGNRESSALPTLKENIVVGGEISEEPSFTFTLPKRRSR